MTANDLLTRHRAVMPRWMGLYYEQPIELVRGHGRHVWDSAGRRYLDFFGGILTTSAGHGVPEILDAVKSQADRLLHASTLYLIESQVALAEAIARRSAIPDAKAFFVNSGSEANDAALMIASAFRRSNQILAMRYSYHGRSFATVPVTGNSFWSPTSFSPFQTIYVHGGHPYRSPFASLGPEAYIDACHEDLDSLLDVAAAGDVAAFIAEPILGVAGFATPPDGLYGRFQKSLAARGILYISDEVQTGWGRTGAHAWGFEAHGVQPDLVTFAKGLGNGLAIAGVVGRGDLMDSLPALSLSTFGGNPLAASGALANLRFLERVGAQANALRQGAAVRARLDMLAARHSFVADVRGKGLMQAFECIIPGSRTPDKTRTSRLLEAAKARGLLIGRGGVYGNAVRLAPALTVTDGETAEGLDLLEAAVADVA
jgi:4-aminobutyrate aminotransferase